MKKIFLTLAACFIFSGLFVACAQYKLYPNKITYAVSAKTPLKSLKVEAYRNKFIVYSNGSPCAEFSFAPGKPLPPPPPPCTPGRCHTLILDHKIGEKMLLYIDGSKTPVTLVTKYETRSFTNAIKNSPDKQLLLSIE